MIYATIRIEIWIRNEEILWEECLKHKLGGSYGKPSNMYISTAVIQLVKQASCHTFHPAALSFSETETLFIYNL